MNNSNKLFENINTYCTKTEYIEQVIEIYSEFFKQAEVEKNKFGEVLTPPQIVEDMLNSLPVEVWSNPNNKWIDPCNGIGTFLFFIIKRLMIGLSENIKNEEERYRHIVENMLYACEIQEKNMQIFVKILNVNESYKLNTFRGDFLCNSFDEHMKNCWFVDKFDIIIMNSPYQTQSEGKHNRSRPLYNLFIEKGIEISDKILSIHPSRWMGKSIGLNEFRDSLLNRKDIRLIKNFNFQNKKNVFGSLVEIRGGIQYFLIDKSYNGLVSFDGAECSLNDFDIFVKPKYHSLLKKIITHNSLSEICYSNSLFMNFHDDKLSKSPCDGYLPCYVSKRKGGLKYIKESDMMNKGKKKIYNWKVFTPFASGYGNKFGYFGIKILGKPGEVCSNTYMTLLVNSENEGDSLISYMNTKFCNFFLSLRKNTQNMNKSTLKWIPIVPFDRTWTDELIVQYFNISNEEVDLYM